MATGMKLSEAHAIRLLRTGNVSKCGGACAELGADCSGFQLETGTGASLCWLLGGLGVYTATRLSDPAFQLFLRIGDCGEGTRMHLSLHLSRPFGRWEGME